MNPLASNAMSKRPSSADMKKSLTYNGTKNMRNACRPQFLGTLLDFVACELRELGVERAVIGHPSRLSVYRQVFESFIQEFKTYESLLSEVKLEYEQAILQQQRELAEMARLKNDFALRKYQNTEDQNALQKELVERIRVLSIERDEWKNSNQEAQKDNKELKGYSKTLETRLEELQERSREDDITRTLVQSLQTDIAQFKQQKILDDAKHKAEIDVLTQETNDTRVSRDMTKDLLLQFQEQYKDTVPRNEHDMLRVEHLSYKERFESSQKSLNDALDRLRQQQGNHEIALAEMIKDTADKIKRAMPDWEHICDVCRGQDIRTYWLRCNGMDCNEVIASLLSMLVKNQQAVPSSGQVGDDPTALMRRESIMPITSISPKVTNKAGHDGEQTIHLKYFIGLGLSSNVPKYLRYKGKIRNRKLTRRNCCLLIREIWDAKAIADVNKKKSGKTFTLAEFFHQYLKRRFQTAELIAEWSYNLIEACKWYWTQRVDCMLFIDILKDHLDEVVYREIATTVEELKEVFERVDTTVNNGQLTGIVPKTLIVLSFRERWKDRNREQLIELESALNADQQGDVVSYKWLFQNETECTFFEVVRLQEMAARETYIKELGDYIRVTYRDAMTLTAIDYSRAIARYDVTKKKYDIDMYVARGFNIFVENVKVRETIAVVVFLRNLARSSLRRG